MQFHFHAPSEHAVAGRQFPMERHLVHRNEEGNLAVVDALLEESARNTGYDVVRSNLPEDAGPDANSAGPAIRWTRISRA